MSEQGGNVTRARYEQIVAEARELIAQVTRAQFALGDKALEIEPMRPVGESMPNECCPTARCCPIAPWRGARAGERGHGEVERRLFATFAPKALRPRLAAWLEPPVLIVPELRTMIRLGVHAYHIRRPAPLPLSEDELSTIQTSLQLLLGKRSLLVHPQRRVEHAPRLVPDVRAEIVSSNGHGPQIGHEPQTADHERRQA